MRSRFPLLLKKRGRRRTGSTAWARSGDLLYQSLFVGVGLVATWWHVANVLYPSVLRNTQLDTYDQRAAQVVSCRVDPSERNGGVDYWPLLKVSVESDDEKAPAVQYELPIGPPTDSEASARDLLQPHAPGETIPIWIDPADSQQAAIYRNARWWPWLVLPVPVSMVILGGIGLCRAALRSGISAERRQKVAQQAGKYDPFSASGVSVAAASGLPPAEAADDSPGVKLPYRLPAEAALGWRLAGMAIIGVVWNVLVVLLLVGVVADFWRGKPNLGVALIVTTLAAAGAWLAYRLLREAWDAAKLGVSQVEIEHPGSQPGQTHRGVLLQSGHFKVRSLRVLLICEEVATYCEGTDTRVSIEEVHHDVLHSQRTFRIEPDRQYEAPFQFTVPRGAMHSFVSPHNEVRWFIEVRVKPVRIDELRRRFRLQVQPPTIGPDQAKRMESEPRAAEALEKPA